MIALSRTVALGKTGAQGESTDFQHEVAEATSSPTTTRTSAHFFLSFCSSSSPSVYGAILSLNEVSRADSGTRSTPARYSTTRITPVNASTGRVHIARDMSVFIPYRTQYMNRKSRVLAAVRSAT